MWSLHDASHGHITSPSHGHITSPSNGHITWTHHMDASHIHLTQTRHTDTSHGHIMHWGRNNLHKDSGHGTMGSHTLVLCHKSLVSVLSTPQGGGIVTRVKVAAIICLMQAEVAAPIIVACLQCSKVCCLPWWCAWWCQCGDVSIAPVSDVSVVMCPLCYTLRRP